MSRCFLVPPVPLTVISIICLFESYQRISQLARDSLPAPTLFRLHPTEDILFGQEEDCGVRAREPAGHQSGGECGQWRVLLPGQRPRQVRPHPPRQRQR